MQAFNLAFLGVIIPMVLIVLCCIISVICGQCRGTVSGRETNGGIRTGGRLGNHARNQNVYSNKIYTISGGNSGSYGDPSIPSKHFPPHKLGPRRASNPLVSMRMARKISIAT